MSWKSATRRAAVILMLAGALGVGALASSTPAVAGDVGGSSRVVGWTSCDDGPDLVLTYMPTTHLLSCADANSGLTRLRWASWTDERAVGTGVYRWNDCDPDCAGGTEYTAKATVVLDRPRTQAGDRVFTRATVTYTDESGVQQVERVTSIRWTG
ncbi:MAG: hypothetical protein Q7V58_17715 [Actinomycetota bacterium]|nr:hypothetical protein [Actinomycetota bacterium]